MIRAQVFGFEWGFLDEISRWTLGIAVLVAGCGAFITGSGWFAGACLAAAALDIGLVTVSVRRARSELEAGRIDSVAPIVMLVGRLLLKAGILLIALVARDAPTFEGAVAGVLIYDITLAFAGSAIAITRGMRRPHEGGGGSA